MAGTALKRLMAEYKQLTLNPPEGIVAGPMNEENFFEWEALIMFFQRRPYRKTEQNTPNPGYDCSLLLDRLNPRRLYGREPEFATAMVSQGGGHLSCPRPSRASHRWFCTWELVGSTEHKKKRATKSQQTHRLGRSQRPPLGTCFWAAEPTCSFPRGTPCRLRSLGHLLSVLLAARDRVPPCSL
ncbi:ubiquitin-conjugating enzyme E2 G2 isoform X2 [Panthera uncia]|uniref:ubiquitin-conjugating enzyme E2 G2 isoform X2 n=1 Tax=Panthera uncia TaxID=29064 RepID=UPI0020FFBED7|nr:ubiquitin-conjugating enzyme E2 G2 isoform X2 [Panthera uncia]